jgi:hypothetical protein
VRPVSGRRSDTAAHPAGTRSAHPRRAAAPPAAGAQVADRRAMRPSVGLVRQVPGDGAPGSRCLQQLRDHGAASPWSEGRTPIARSSKRAGPRPVRWRKSCKTGSRAEGRAAPPRSRFRISCRSRIRPRPSASARRGYGRSPPDPETPRRSRTSSPRARWPVPPSPSTGGCRARPRSRAGAFIERLEAVFELSAALREVCHGNLLRVVPRTGACDRSARVCVPRRPDALTSINTGPNAAGLHGARALPLARACGSLARHRPRTTGQGQTPHEPQTDRRRVFRHPATGALRHGGAGRKRRQDGDLQSPRRREPRPGCRPPRCSRRPRRRGWPSSSTR